MAQSYGKFPRSSKTKTPPPSDKVTVKFHGRHTIEQFSLEVQKAIARLHDLGAYGLEDCTLYLKPLDEKGQPIALWDDERKQITKLDISLPAAAGPYRPD